MNKTDQGIELISLDTNLSDFDIPNKVKNSLERMNIRTLLNLYNTPIEKISSFPSIGYGTTTQINKIINDIKKMKIYFSDIESFEDFIDFDLCNKVTSDDVDNIKKIRMILSRNSDNDRLRENITIGEIIRIKNEEELSEQDTININLLLKFIDNRIKHGDKNIEDFVSPLTAKFDSIKELHDFIEDCFSNLKEKEGKILKLRLDENNNLTLEDLGERYGITRERVRQLEARAYKKIYSMLELKLPKIYNSLTDKYYFSKDLGVAKLVFELLKEKSKVKIYKIQDRCYYILNTFYDEFMEELERIENKIKGCGNFNIKSDESIFDSNTILNLFSNKYRILDDIIYFNTTNIDALKIILKNANKALCIVDKEDFDYIINSLKEEYNITISGNVVRNIEKVFGDYCVLWGPRKYIHPSNIKIINYKLINDIKKFINNNKITNSKEIYNEFKEDLKPYDILNDTALYGYLKYYFPEDYNYGGVSGVISMVGENNSWGVEIIELIKSKQRPLTTGEIFNKYSAITSTIINNLSINFENIIKWGRDRFYLKELIVISEEEKNIIFQYIVDQKMVYTTNIYNYINNTYPDILKRNFIDNEKILGKFIKLIFNDIFTYKESDNLICFF